VEFRLQDEVALVLEQAARGEKLPAVRGRISWLYQVADPEPLLARLKEHGCEPLRDEQERLGYRVMTFADPEGNPFLLHLDRERDKS